MIREFKFFHGITIQTEGIQGIVRTLRAQWRHEPTEEIGLDITSELTRLMSEQISEEIDNEIINILTGRINGGQRA